MKKWLAIIVIIFTFLISQFSFTESSIIEKLYILKNKDTEVESHALINDGQIYLKISDIAKISDVNFDIGKDFIIISKNESSTKQKKYFENGDIYVGNLVNGLRSGEGILYIKGGGKYQGQWKNDKYDGDGMLIMADGSIYDGSFSEGFIHGEGKYTYSTGETYTGNFEYGIKSGFGKYYKDTKNKYTGYWKNGLREGKGNGIVDGKPQKGIWEKNKLIKILTNSQFDF